MITRLKIKFVCVNMLIVTVMLVVIFGFVLTSTSKDIEERGHRQLQSIQEHPSPRRKFHPDERRIPYFTVKIFPSGEMELHAHSFFEFAQESDLLELAKDVYAGNDSTGVLKEQSLRFSRRTVRDGVLLVFMDISVEQGIMSRLIVRCVWIGAASYLLFFCISVLFAQWAIRPVETAWKNQRQFVADASHELKTPLSVIMTNAELLLDDSYEITAKEKFADNIFAMSRQMRGLVEALLDLSRVDNGVVKTTFTKLDFSELISDCILPFEPLFFEKGMTLEVQIEEGIELHGSETHLRQVAEILLDNAAKYGTAEMPAEVHLSRQGRYVQFSVATSGDEISAKELKNIFRRFYRVDQTRTMNGSYGLGLSIAESIVKEHRGKIWAESRNRRNRFVVQLKAQYHGQQ